MPTVYFLDQESSRIFLPDGSVFDAWSWRWKAGDGAVPVGCVEVDAAAAVEAVTGAARSVPVGVIGPREATAAQMSCAEAIGGEIAALGLALVCGGRGGVMAAAAKGSLEAGGVTIGLLPDSDWRKANPYIRIPIATGLGEARNMIIAKSCAALIAVGSSYGTLTEVGFALHFGKPVLGLEQPPEVEGVWKAPSVSEAIARLAELLLDPSVQR